MHEISTPTLTVVPGVLERIALVDDELVAGGVEGGEIGIGRGAGTGALVHRKLFRGEDLDLAQAQATLDADQLQEHVLAHESPSTGECLRDAFLWERKFLPSLSRSEGIQFQRVIIVIDNEELFCQRKKN